MQRIKVIQSPTNEQSLRNCVAINPDDFPQDIEYIELIFDIPINKLPEEKYIFNVEPHKDIPHDCVGFNLVQRKWAQLILHELVYVRPYRLKLTSNCMNLCTIVLKADFILKSRTTWKPYDTDLMAEDFLSKFSGQIFTVGQQLAFSFQEKQLLGLVVKDLEVPDITSIKDGQILNAKKARMGRCSNDTVIKFEKSNNSALNLIRSHNIRIGSYSIIGLNWILAGMKYIYLFTMHHISRFFRKFRDTFVKKSIC